MLPRRLLAHTSSGYKRVARLPQHFSTETQAQNNNQGVQTLNSDTPFIPNEIKEDVVHFEVTPSESTSAIGDQNPFQRQTLTEINLKEYFQRPRLVGSYDLSSSAVVNLNYLWCNLAPVSSLISQWSLMRGTMHVRCVYTGATTSLGMTRMSFVPREVFGVPYTQSERRIPYNITSTSQLMHHDMSFSQACTKEVELPHVFRNQFVAPETSTWLLVFTPINALAKADGNTPEPLTADIFVWYTDLDLQVLVPQGKELDEPRLSKFLSYGSALASSVSFPFSSAISTALNIGSKAALWAGWSRPPAQMDDGKVMRHVSEIGVASGAPHISYSLGMDPAVSKPKSALPLAQEGETQLHNLWTRWSQLRANFQVSTILNVHPTEVAGTSPYLPTTLAYYSLPFTYYTGGFDLKFQFISSPLIRWRVLIAILPPNASVPPDPSAFDTGSVLTEVVEVVGDTEIVFNVPYLYLENFQKMRGFTYASVDPSLTRVIMYSLNEPTGPSPTPVYPYCNIYIKGGDDFSCAVPSTELIDNYALPHSTIRAFEYQGIENVGEYQFGEIYSDIKLLSKRPCVAGYINGNTNNHIALPQEPIAPIANSTGTTVIFNYGSTPYIPNWTLYSWLAFPFYAAVGGFESKFEPVTIDTAYPNDGANGLVHITTSLGLPSSGGPAWSLASLRTARGSVPLDYKKNPLLEVSIPDRNQFQFRHPTYLHSTDGVATSYVESTNLDFFTVPSIAMHWLSPRDDLDVAGYLCTPELIDRPLG